MEKQDKPLENGEKKSVGKKRKRAERNEKALSAVHDLGLTCGLGFVVGSQETTEEKGKSSPKNKNKKHDITV
jgi:hypothetical protein